MSRKKAKYVINSGRASWFEVVDDETNEMIERFSSDDVNSDGIGFIGAKEARKRANVLKKQLNQGKGYNGSYSHGGTIIKPNTKGRVEE